MSSRIAFLLCARNKAQTVERAARSMLAQVGDPITVVFSDHSSTDGTGAILRRLADEYQGQHKVLLLTCPATEYRGILGLNAHLAWAMEQLTDHDLVIFSSADDENYPNRAQRIAEVYEKRRCDYIATRFEVRGNPGAGYVPVEQRGDGFVPFEHLIRYHYGIRAGCAWTTELWRRHGPLRDLEAVDFIMPAMAALERRAGLYWIDEALHDSHMVADPHGVSVERAMQAVNDDVEWLRLAETNLYQFTSSHGGLMRRIADNRFSLTQAEETALARKVLTSVQRWVRLRDMLTKARMQPALFPV